MSIASTEKPALDFSELDIATSPALPEGVTFERDLDTDDMVVNIGPQHPSTHGVLRLITTLNGELVKNMEPVIGYLHRSKEKMAESRGYFQYQPTIDRVEYLSSFYDHYAYVACVEAIAKLKVPRRVQYIRLITMELNRISSHLLWFGTFLLDLGASSPFFYAFREREDIFKLFEDVTGARMMYNYYRFGGVNADIPDGWIGRVLAFCDTFMKRIDEYETIVTKNPIVLDRTVGQGIMTYQDCLDYGVTGPNMRAAGVAQDLRKTAPYSCYDEVEFDVPTDTRCDTYARYLVRMAEMRESIRIIRQACKQIPGGDGSEVARLRKEIEERNKLAKSQADAIKADAIQKGEDPAQRQGAKFIEEKLDPDLEIWGQKVNLLTFKVPAGEAFVSVESPRGVLGCYMVADGSPKPQRVKWRGASFSNLSILPKLMQGHLYSDLMAIFGSL
ncbi:MAG: NADH-quinone oxidoreductase subunit D, partial [Vampirovibrionales bacterium]|nr:NADH-quinone oxidoreductase subunit D [Vampirovibrionales bacterium]